MNGIVIVGCVYGLATTKKFVKSMNETTCVVMKTYLHVTKGDDYNGKPKWEGSSTIQEILNGIIENLDEINQLAIGLSENKEKLDEQYENFKVFSQTKEEGIDQLKVTNPNVFDTSIDKVKPIYAFNREDKIKNLNSFIEQIVDSVDSLTKQVESLKDSENIKETKSKLNDAINKIQDITSEFTDNEDVLNDWVKYQKDVNKYSNKTSYFIFIFIAGLAIISLFLSLFLVGQVCFFFPKLFLHIIWNINQILLIIIFLLGSFLGIIGVLLTDGVDVFNYAISEENLNEKNN
jgi:tetrahydromethanopterin S-methyltransferase subunit B